MVAHPGDIEAHPGVLGSLGPLWLILEPMIIIPESGDFSWRGSLWSHRWGIQWPWWLILELKGVEGAQRKLWIVPLGHRLILHSYRNSPWTR
jgi:hypothetical protein